MAQEVKRNEDITHGRDAESSIYDDTHIIAVSWPKKNSERSRFRAELCKKFSQSSHWKRACLTC